MRDRAEVPERQRGAALVISLVLVAMALMLSLSSMQGSRLEETMAGNQRAAERALRAAEFGAARVALKIQEKQFSDATVGTFASELFECETGATVCFTSGENEIEPGVYFRIIVDTGAGSVGFTRRLTAQGLVYSGDNSGELVAMRELDFFLRLDGLGKLAAFNPGCVSSYKATSNSSEIEGEDVVEVNGAYEPAVYTGSLAEANEVVEGILLSSDTKELAMSGNYADDDKVIFVYFPDDSGGATDVGVYHARDVVVANDGSDIGSQVAVNHDEVTVDYGLNCPNNNAMCNYTGGVASYTGAAILNDPAAFHDFIAAVFRDPNANFTSFSTQNLVFPETRDFAFDDDDGVGGVPVGINVITNDHHSLLANFAADQSDGSIEYRAPAVFEDAATGSESFSYDSDGDGDNDATVDKVVLAGGVIGDQDGEDVNPASLSGSDLELDASSVMENDGRFFAKYHVAPSSGSTTASIGVEYAASYFPSSQDYYVADGTSPDGDFISVCPSDSSKACYYLDTTSPTNDAYTDDVVDLNHDGTLDDDGDGSETDVIGVKRDCMGCSSTDARTLTAENDAQAYEDKGGILIVDGHAQFKGNPDFKGIIIVLGDYTIGGGGGDNFYGASVVYPYFHHADDDAFQCQLFRAENNGGGNHDTIHQREAIDAALGLMSTEAWEAWIIGNDSTQYSYYLEGWEERLVN